MDVEVAEVAWMMGHAGAPVMVTEVPGMMGPVEVAVGVVAVVDVAINGGHLTLIHLLIKFLCSYYLKRKYTAVLMTVMIMVLIAVIEVMVLDNNCGRSSEGGDQDAYGNGNYRMI